jgi:hypothetical protein
MSSSEALEEGSFAQSKRGKRTNTQTRNELAQSAIHDVPAWSEVSNDICESIMTNSDFTVFKFWRRTAAQAILAITLTGCDDLVVAPALASTCKVFGICDEPPLPAEMIDVLCDSSIGSSCTRETLDKTLPRTLQYAVKRPGTRMRLWLLGKSVADTTVAGERESATMPAHTSQRARKAFDEKFAANGEEYFMAAVAPIFALPPIRRSPLAEAVSKIALADSGQLTRQLIIVTDAREVSSLGDFECGLLPTDAGFVKKLQRRRILGPSTLTGIRVQLVFVQSTTVPSRGCPVQLEREMRIRELWTAALLAAGAKDVRIRTGAPSFDIDGTATEGAEKEQKK